MQYAIMRKLGHFAHPHFGVRLQRGSVIAPNEGNSYPTTQLHFE